ncbi:hypothetical protein H0H81_001646 [Sphagnurus paluster]|uniref:Uncharacterized protein n=1 Tax=Sphagnurus paluster TaxID=117069 RepID=A0A9P7K2V3_9AGAR|nr:hypothetical protein H0H81_001646 [Sphagnurus paluster]
MSSAAEREDSEQAVELIQAKIQRTFDLASGSLSPLFLPVTLAKQRHLNLTPTSPFSDSKITIYSPIGSNNATPYLTFETALSTPLTPLSDELAEDLLNNFHLFTPTPSPSPSATPFPLPPSTLSLPLQFNMAAPARHMPFCSQSSAPTLVTGSNSMPELARFFTNVEYLFEDCQINTDADKKQHILHYLELQDSRLWELLPTFTAGTYAAWRNKVQALYPGTSEKRRYSVADLHILVGKWNMRVISNIVQLGEFHRAFLNISQFLMSHMRLSENKRDRAFQMAFTPDQWDNRLVITDINHHPDDPWPMPQILKAAEYILHGTVPPMIPVQQPAPALARLAPVAAQEQLSVKDDGKCQRNHEGRIVLPSGAFVPSNTPSDNIKAKINEWHRRNPGQLAAGQMTANTGTMLYEVNQVLSYDAPPPHPPAVSAEEQIQHLAAT